MQPSTRAALAAKYGRRDCTLNGNPATVYDRDGFAFVRPQNHLLAGFEWSWQSAANILDNGGKFKAE